MFLKVFMHFKFSDYFNKNIVKAKNTLKCLTVKLLHRQMCTWQMSTRQMSTKRMSTWRMSTRQMSTRQMSIRRIGTRLLKLLKTTYTEECSVHTNSESCNIRKRRNSWPPYVSAFDALNDYVWQRHLVEKSRFKCIVYKTNNKYYEILTIYKCVEK